MYHYKHADFSEEFVSPPYSNDYRCCRFDSSTSLNDNVSGIRSNSDVRVCFYEHIDFGGRLIGALN